MKKQITFFVLLLVVGSWLFAHPVLVHAQTAKRSLPFGGIVSFPITCNCSGGQSWIWFTPLYLGGPIVITGPMLYSPFSTILYGYYNVSVPTVWDLGDYDSGGQCQIIIGTGCASLPFIGLMNKVGTSYPGFSI